MVRYIKIIIIILLFSCSYIDELRTEDMLTWEDCVKEAVKNNPDLIAEKENLIQAKADKSIAVSDLLPQISSSASGKTSRASTGVTTDTYSYSITGSQLLFDGFKTPYDIASASEDLKSTLYSYEVTSSNIRLSLRVAFTELLKAQELLGITKDIASRREKSLKLVQLRYEAGREHRGSLLTAQANLAQAEFEVSQAERNITLAQRRLIKEMGWSDFIPVKIKGDFDIVEMNRQKPDLESLADNTPFLKDLIAKKDAARFDLKSSRADFFPQVYLDSSAGKTASKWPPNRDTWSVGLSVSLPIFEGGSRIAQVNKAKSVYKEAQADEISGRDSVILTLEESWKDLQDTIDEIEVKRKFFEAAEERAKITVAQYETGLTSFDDWIIIEDNLVSAKKAYLNAQADMMIAEAYWIQAIGGTL